MVYTKYSFMDALNLYAKMSAQYLTFPIFVVMGILLVLIIAFNMDNKNGNFIFIGLNIALTGVIIYSKGLDLVEHADILFNSFIKNSYFYFVNTVISFIVVSRIIHSKRITKTFKNVSLGFYLLIIVNLMFTIYISNYLSNIDIMVAINTYPMVYFGNIISFGLYIALFLDWAVFMKKKKVHRLGNHL